MKLCIDNLPEGCHQQELRDVLSLYGDVARVSMRPACCGCSALAEMTTPEAADKAKQRLDGQIYCDALLKVRSFAEEA